MRRQLTEEDRRRSLENGRKRRKKVKTNHNEASTIVTRVTTNPPNVAMESVSLGDEETETISKNGHDSTATSLSPPRSTIDPCLASSEVLTRKQPLLRNKKYNLLTFGQKYLVNTKTGKVLPPSKLEENVKKAFKSCSEIDVLPILQAWEQSENSSQKDILLMMSSMCIKMNRDRMIKQAPRRTEIPEIDNKTYVFSLSRIKSDEGFILPTGYLFILKKLLNDNDEREGEVGSTVPTVEPNVDGIMSGDESSSESDSNSESESSESEEDDEDDTQNDKSIRSYKLPNLIQLLVKKSITEACKDDEYVSMLTVVSKKETKNNIYVTIDDKFIVYLRRKIMAGILMKKEESTLDIVSYIDNKVSEAINYALGQVRKSIRNLKKEDFDKFRDETILAIKNLSN